MRFVSHVDIAPTILELAGLPSDASLSGMSLLPDLAGSSHTASQANPGREAGEGRDRFIFSMLDDEVRHWCTAVQRGSWKLIDCRGTTALFNLAADPGEQRDVSARYPERLAALQGAFDARAVHRSDESRKRAQPDDGKRDERIRALRAMGYIE